MVKFNSPPQYISEAQHAIDPISYTNEVAEPSPASTLFTKNYFSVEFAPVSPSGYSDALMETGFFLFLRSTVFPIKSDNKPRLMDEGGRSLQCLFGAP